MDVFTKKDEKIRFYVLLSGIICNKINKKRKRIQKNTISEDVFNLHRR